MSLIEEHLNIQSVEDFANYIDKMSGGLPFGLLKMDNYSFGGFFNLSQFYINYARGKSLLLSFNGTDEDYEKFKNIIAPVMWYKDESIKDGIIGPLLSYTANGGTRMLVWNYVDPENMLNEVLTKTIKAGEDLGNLEVYLKGFDLDEFKEGLKYGNNTSYFSAEELRKIENMSEFDVYIALRVMLKTRHELEKNKKGMGSSPELEEKIDAMKYRIAFMIQKLSQFGVNVPSPSSSFDGYTIDVVAWLEWWQDAFNDILKKYPDIVPFKTDTHGLRPDGDYKDYIDVIKGKEKGEPE